jgi:hypothetical protein
MTMKKVTPTMMALDEHNHERNNNNNDDAK